MVDAITCNVTIANMISVGCVWVIGRLMDQNTTNARDIKRTPILLTSQLMLKQGKL